MQEDERQVAVGGVLSRAGCRLVPFLRVKAAGLLIVTTRRLSFEPVLFYKLLARKVDLDLQAVEGAESTGSNVELNLMDIIAIGKVLTIRLTNGRKITFRSQQADLLAEAINQAVRQSRG